MRCTFKRGERERHTKTRILETFFPDTCIDGMEEGGDLRRNAELRRHLENILLARKDKRERERGRDMENAPRSIETLMGWNWRERERGTDIENAPRSIETVMEWNRICDEKYTG
jgi:hypothetical protein